MSEDNRTRIQVVAGVLVDAEGRVLIAQRPHHKHLGGRWEFPGGKIEPDEMPADALTRELREEIGILVSAAHPLIRIQHTYPDRHVDLHVWTVTEFEGHPTGLEGQGIAWCLRDQLPGADLVPADEPIVTALRLPERIIDRDGRAYGIVAIEDLKERRSLDGCLLGCLCRNHQDIESEVAGALASGADFLLLPEDFDPAAAGPLLASIEVPVYLSGVTLEAAWRYGASGIHQISG